MQDVTTKKMVTGGSFLIEMHDLDSLFTPEEFSAEDHMMADAIDQFVDGEVLPQVKQLQKGNNEDMVGLLKQAGELGLLGAEVPELYGGMQISKRLASLISEKTSKEAGFAVSAGRRMFATPSATKLHRPQAAAHVPELRRGRVLPERYRCPDPTRASHARGAHDTHRIQTQSKLMRGQS